MFDIRLLMILVFLILGATLIFSAQSRTNIVAALIVMHLNLIVFLSLTITNQDLFKEIILVLILYLIITIFIITKQDDVVLKVKKIKAKLPNYKVIIFASFMVILIFVCSVILTKISFDKMQKVQIIQLTTPELAPNQALLEDSKKMRVARKLHENFLLKHSSDLILIVVFLSLAVLFFSSNLSKKQNDL